MSWADACDTDRGSEAEAVASNLAVCLILSVSVVVVVKSDRPFLDDDHLEIRLHVYVSNSVEPCFGRPFGGIAETLTCRLVQSHCTE